MTFSPRSNYNLSFRWQVTSKAQQLNLEKTWRNGPTTPTTMTHNLSQRFALDSRHVNWPTLSRRWLKSVKDSSRESSEWAMYANFWLKTALNTYLQHPKLLLPLAMELHRSKSQKQQHQRRKCRLTKWKFDIIFWFTERMGRDRARNAKLFWNFPT